MLGLRDARRVSWRRRGGDWFDGYLTLGDDGLRLAGRAGSGTADVSLTIPVMAVGRVGVGVAHSDPSELRPAAVLELPGQEPIEIVPLLGGVLELEQLARRLNSVLAPPRSRRAAASGSV
jgi:hypothetical protein